MQHIDAPVRYRAQPVSRSELGARRIFHLAPLVKIGNPEYLSKVIHVYQKRFLFDLRSINREHYLRVCRGLITKKGLIICQGGELQDLLICSFTNCNLAETRILGYRLSIPNSLRFGEMMHDNIP